MAHTKSTARSSGKGPAAGNRPGTGRMDGGKTLKAVKRQAPQPDRADVNDDPDVTGDIEGMPGAQQTGKPLDAEARRRIEILREERALQQALYDDFHFQGI